MRVEFFTVDTNIVYFTFVAVITTLLALGVIILEVSIGATYEASSIVADTTTSHTSEE